MKISRVDADGFDFEGKRMGKRELLSIIKEALLDIDIDVENEQEFFDLEEIRQEAHDEGFQEGLDENQDDIYERGFEAGHDAGYDTVQADKENQVPEVLSEVEEIHCLKTAGGAPIKYENIVDTMIDIHYAEKKESPDYGI